MIKKIGILFLFTLFISVKPVFSQVETSVFIGTKIPLMYSAGVKMKLYKRLVTSIQGGVLAKPFNEISLSLLDAYDPNSDLTELLGGAFEIGYALETTVFYEFSKKYYTGIFFNHMNVRSTDGPQDFVKSALYPFITDDLLKLYIQTHDLDLQVRSNLLNGGILVGRKFYLKNTKFQFSTELALSRNLSSKSFLYLESEKTSFSAYINKQLEVYYLENAFFPTLNVYLVYKLNKKE